MVLWWWMCVMEQQQTLHTTGSASVGKTYSFSSVFGPDTTQEALYTSVGLPTIKHVVSGNNAFVFAFAPPQATTTNNHVRTQRCVSGTGTA